MQDAEVDLDTERGLSGLQKRVRKKFGGRRMEGRTHVPSDGVDKVERDEVVARLVESVGRVLLLPYPPYSVEVRVCAERAERRVNDRLVRCEREGGATDGACRTEGLQESSRRCLVL